MHYCPDCSQACHCNGDIDDCPVFIDSDGPAWCRCPDSPDCMAHANDDEDVGDYCVHGIAFDCECEQCEEPDDGVSDGR